MRWSFGYCPIFILRSGHSGQFALVRGRKNRVATTCLCDNENVVRPDGRSGALQRGADIARLLGDRGLKGKNSIGPDRKSTMRCALRSGRAILAAPYRSSNSTMDDIESVRPSPIAASIPARTGEVRR